MATTIVKIRGGTVEVAPLAAYVQTHLHQLSQFPTPPTEVVSGLGGTEVHSARPGTEAYEQYLQQYAKAEERRQRYILAAATGIAVTRWTINGIAASEPPEGWQPNPLFAPIALSTLLDPVPPVTAEVLLRADFLLFEVLVAPDDLSAVIAAAVGGVREEEIASAAEFFRGEVQGEAAQPVAGQKRPR